MKREIIGAILLAFLALPIALNVTSSSKKTNLPSSGVISASALQNANNNLTGIHISSQSHIGYNESTTTNKSYANASVIYVVYSPTCPHCHHLLSYLETVNTPVKIVKTMDSVNMMSCLRKHNISWDFGVPLVVAFTKNKTYVMEGYPASIQDKNGYFMGKNFEENLCKQEKGKPIYINGIYSFCVLPDGKILGN